LLPRSLSKYSSAAPLTWCHARAKQETTSPAGASTLHVHLGTDPRFTATIIAYSGCRLTWALRHKYSSADLAVPVARHSGRAGRHRLRQQPLSNPGQRQLIVANDQSSHGTPPAKVIRPRQTRCPSSTSAPTLAPRIIANLALPNTDCRPAVNLAISLTETLSHRVSLNVIDDNGVLKTSADNRLFCDRPDHHPP
jgi:hypothetical protein